MTYGIELINEDLASKLNKNADSFTLNFWHWISNDIMDTAQLLISIGINDNFEITEEFLAMEFLKGKTLGEDLYDSMPRVIKRYKLPWSTLTNVTID